MLVEHDTTRALVSLVPDGALLLAGDHVEVDVRVDDGARLDLIEPGGTVAFPMRGAGASWDVRVEVGAGATLTWAGEPFVVAEGADVRRRTRIRCAPTGTLLLRETLVLGRHQEASGRIRQQLTVVSDGVPVLVEDLGLDAKLIGPLLGGRRVIGTVLALGVDLADLADQQGPDRFDLDVPCAVLWRSLAAEAHALSTPSAWTSALRALDANGLRAANVLTGRTAVQ